MNIRTVHIAASAAALLSSQACAITVEVAPGEPECVRRAAAGLRADLDRACPGHGADTRRIVARTVPDGRWEADVPIEQKHRFQVAVWFEQLYVNGRRAKRARYPNEGFLQAKGAKPTLLAGDTELMELFANGDDLAPLANCSFAHLRLAHLVVHHKWSSTRRPIRGYDAARGVVFTEGKSVTKWNTWDANSTYYVENAPFALDEPGEWLYDGEAKKIVYIPRPGETLETTRFQYPVPGLVTILRIAGDPEKETFVHDIVFENIAFAFSDSPRRQCFKGRKGLPSGEIGDDSSFGPSEWPGGQAAAHTSAAVLMSPLNWPVTSCATFINPSFQILAADLLIAPKASMQSSPALAAASDIPGMAASTSFK